MSHATQWGRTSYNRNGDNSQIRCYFPIAFSSACYSVIGTETVNSGHAMYGALWKYPSTTYFDYKEDSDNVCTMWVAYGK